MDIATLQKYQYNTESQERLFSISILKKIKGLLKKLKLAQLHLLRVIKPQPTAASHHLKDNQEIKKANFWKSEIYSYCTWRFYLAITVNSFW